MKSHFEILVTKRFPFRTTVPKRVAGEFNTRVNNDALLSFGYRVRVNCAEMVQRLRLRLQALFFDVTAEKVDQRCSTFLLPQLGHRTLPSSYSTRDKILSKNFLHFWQKNS